MAIPKSRKRVSFSAERSTTLPVRDLRGFSLGRMRRLATTKEPSQTNPTIRIVQPNPTEVNNRRIAMGKTIPATEPPVKVTPEASPRW